MLTGSLQSNDDTCDFCSRKGHKMDKCFKFSAAKKAAVEAAKAPRTKPKQAFPPIAGAMFTQQEYDSDTEFPSHKLNFNTHCSDLCSKALLSQRSSGLKSTDVILDTGTNGSIVHNLELLHHVRSSPQLCCLLKLLKVPEGKMASRCMAEDKMVNPQCLLYG